MTVRYNNINALIKKLKKDEKKSGEIYYYRGQIHNWPIESSISRVNNNKEESSKTLFFVTKFLNNPSLHLKDDNAEDIQRCYAIAQHYGYKTDLIDFTTNLEVAAYFATDGIEEHPDFKYGYLWRISEKEILIIKKILELTVKNIEETNNNDSVKQCLSILKSLDFNPFFSVSIPELSRMNNQQGVFLWDLYGIVVNQYFRDREPDFEFRHNGNVYSSNTLNSELIYPKPNALELEIERFKSVEAMVEFQNSELMNVINASPGSFVLKVENTKSKIADYLNDNDWPQNFGDLSTDFEKSIKKTEQIFIKNPLNSKEKIIEIIKTNKLNISYGNRISISLCEEDFAEVINEVIETLIYYNYTPEEIYLVISNITKQYYKVKENDSSFKDFIKGYKYKQNDLHGENMLYIGMKDKLGVESYAYIPWKIIANKRLYLLDKLGNDIPKDIKELFEKENLWSLFLDLNKNPQKMFNFDEIKQIFLNYVLPYQFIIRPKNSRIYNPAFLKIFGPE
ncbi:FRG domain-containing protein [Streptococcus mitis]|uniref:FRG domain-containing protein n=1 Tax=Streptococcus mitis TaxID=28037 RepID=UPI0021B52557|nr:FRG domain-containing protein [Streptococcus mitis]